MQKICVYSGVCLCVLLRCLCEDEANAQLLSL